MKPIELLLLLLLSTHSYAATYKWTDEQGNIHYGERPPNRLKATSIAPPPPPASSSSNSRERLKSIQEGILKQTKDRIKEKEEEKKKEKENEQISEYCEKLRKRITAFQNNSRIRQQDKEGSYSYLADEQKQKQQQEMQKKLAKNCS